MKISNVEFTLAEALSRHDAAPIRSVVISLVSDDGLQGWGEAPLPWRLSELAPRQTALLPLLAGRSVFDIEEMVQVLDRLEGPHGAMLSSGLEMAAWDMIGKACGEPVGHFWGGAYRSRIPLVIEHHAQTEESVRQAARDLSEHGFHAQLLHCTGDTARDAAAIEAVSDSVGEPAEIYVDAHGRLSPQALDELLRRHGELIALLIDPPPDTRQRMPLLANSFARIAVAQEICSPRDVLQAARAGFKHVIADLHRVGGISAIRRCGAVAEAAGVRISLRAAGSLGISLAAMLHIASSSAVFETGHITDYPQLQEDILTEPLQLADGAAAPPRLPGLGVTVAGPSES